MPMLSELRHRFHSESVDLPLPETGDDVFVVDARSRLTPAQFVEKKLRAAMKAHTYASGAQEDDAGFRSS